MNIKQEVLSFVKPLPYFVCFYLGLALAFDLNLNENVLGLIFGFLLLGMSLGFLEDYIKDKILKRLGVGK